VINMANPLRDLTQDEIERECAECDNSGGCGDCTVMEEIKRREDMRISRLTDDELEIECLDCEDTCGHCAIDRELDYRRMRCTGRDVRHNGSIIKGGGVCQPEWMDDDQYAEYKMGAEYAYEVSYVGFDEPDEDDYY